MSKISNKITKAILPVAGFGTRFLPATKAQPKEMLPVFDTPAIQFIVEEAAAAGIEDIIIVTGRNKRSIEDHFDANSELEAALECRGKNEELDAVRKISGLANFIYVRQPSPLGDGDAILQAKNLIGEDEAVVVLFGDDLVDPPKGGFNAVEQLISVYEKTKSPVVLLDEVAPAEVHKYGIVCGDITRGRAGKISHFVEKPTAEAAPSNLGVVGKFILTRDMFDVLENVDPHFDGEVRLANAFVDYLGMGKSLYGKILDGVRFDTGDKVGFLRATVHFARKNGVSV